MLEINHHYNSRDSNKRQQQKLHMNIRIAVINVYKRFYFSIKTRF